jgi:hypothetical protein
LRGFLLSNPPTQADQSACSTHRQKWRPRGRSCFVLDTGHKVFSITSKEILRWKIPSACCHTSRLLRNIAAVHQKHKTPSSRGFMSDWCVGEDLTATRSVPVSHLLTIGIAHKYGRTASNPPRKCLRNFLLRQSKNRLSPAFLLCVGEDLNLRSPSGRWIYSPLHLTALPPTRWC